VLMGTALTYYTPGIEQWASMTFLMRVHWLAWLIVLAVLVYGGMLILLGIRKSAFIAGKFEENTAI